MYTIIGLMFIGMLFGLLMRKQRLSGIHRIITLLIWLLLFLLGVEVGSNEKIIKGIHSLGLEAFILTIGGLLGSVIAAWVLWKTLYKKEEEKS